MNTFFKCIANWGHPRLLVLGDLMLDRYTWGDAERVSPEAPVLVLTAATEEVRLGGAASVAALLRGLEANVSLAGVIGPDASGRLMRTLLHDDSIDDSLVFCDSDRRTTTKDRFLGRSASCAAQQVLRVDYEQRHNIPAEIEEQLRQSISNRLSEFEAVLVSDYAKGVCTTGLLRSLIAAARNQNTPVLVDPGRGVDFDRYRGSTIVKPNRLEAQEATGSSIRSPVDAMAAGKMLCSKYAFDAVLVTLDRDGMVACRANHTAEAHSTNVHHVCDITGAGDMVLATIGLALAERMTLTDAARLANFAAGMEVERQGVAVILRRELIQALDNDSARRPEQASRPEQAVRSSGRRKLLRAIGNDSASRPEQAKRSSGGRELIRAMDDNSVAACIASRLLCSGPKLLALDDAVRISASHRRCGRTVVFTNGCFDLLHVGHVTYLQAAAELGDVLFVAINSDTSVRRLKGQDRPLIPQSDRAAMLAALSCVAHVLIFEEDTPHRLLEAIRPKVLVKGGTTMEVIGREVVEAYGGRVCLVGEVRGISTTQLVSHIKESSCV